MTSRVRGALFVTGLLFLSQAFSFPSPVRDVTLGTWATGYQFDYSAWYLVFAPFCMLADACTLLGVRGSYALIAWILVFILIYGRNRKGAFLLFGFIGFLAWGALVPRPMARLIPPEPNTLLIDFHSHSNVSHDGRPSFTPEANRTWHRKQGFHAAFITDHNQIESAQIAKKVSRNDWSQGYSSLQGEEISLYRTHLVVLGVGERIDNQPFDSDPAKIPLFIQYVHQRGMPVIASLPEYWFYHWGEGVVDFVRWGIDGFEVVNSAPKALDFPTPLRNEILRLCSTHNLFITGISDNHGYGYATAVWNAMDLPGWQKMNPDQLEKAVLLKLKEGYRAVSVLERPRLGFAYAGGLLDPWAALYGVWALLTPALLLSWVSWIWLIVFLYSAVASHSQRSGPRH